MTSMTEPLVTAATFRAARRAAYDLLTMHAVAAVFAKRLHHSDHVVDMMLTEALAARLEYEQIDREYARYLADKHNLTLSF